jgi:hypothetical protein
MSQYPDLVRAIDGMVELLSVKVRRGQEATVEECPACGVSRVIFDDDTDPEGYLRHAKTCPVDLAYRARMHHEFPFFERPELVAAVKQLLDRPYLPGSHDEWQTRTARAILAALDVRIRHREPKPEKKP